MQVGIGLARISKHRLAAEIAQKHRGMAVHVGIAESTGQKARHSRIKVPQYVHTRSGSPVCLYKHIIGPGPQTGIFHDSFAGILVETLWNRHIGICPHHYIDRTKIRQKHRSGVDGLFERLCLRQRRVERKAEMHKRRLLNRRPHHSLQRVFVELQSKAPQTGLLNTAVGYNSRRFHNRIQS